MDSKKNVVNTIRLRQIEKNNELALGAAQKDIAKYEKILSAYGNVVPLIVADAEGMYQLVDGHARFEACTRIGVSDVPVVVTKSDNGEEQIKLSLLLSASREQGSSLSEGALIEKLIKEYGQTLGELSKFTGRSKSWLSKRQTMARNLSNPIREMVLSGALCTRTAEEISKLPPEEQSLFAANIVKEGFCKDDVHELVRLYRSPDASLELCKSIIESPAVVLTAYPKVGKTRKKSTCNQSDENRIRGVIYHAISILNTIKKMLIESGDIMNMFADSSVIKLQREIQLVDKFISVHVNSSVSLGKRDELYD